MPFIPATPRTLLWAKLFQRISAFLSFLSLTYFFLFLNIELLHLTLGFPENLCRTTIDYNPFFSSEDHLSGLFLKETFNICLILVFSLQHSLMAREGFKEICKEINQKYVFFERSLFTFTASLCLGLALFLHQPNDKVFIDFSCTMTNSFMLFLLFLHVLLEFKAFYDMRDADLLGFAHIRLFEEKLGTTYPIEFIERKPSLLSQMMRHPIYYGLLAHLWLSSTKITYGRIMFNIYLTIFIIIGTYFEEKEIIRKYPNYAEYMKNTPNKFFPNLAILGHSYTSAKGTYTCTRAKGA